MQNGMYICLSGRPPCQLLKFLTLSLFFFFFVRLCDSKKTKVFLPDVPFPHSDVSEAVPCVCTMILWHWMVTSWFLVSLCLVHQQWSPEAFPQSPWWSWICVQVSLCRVHWTSFLEMWRRRALHGGMGLLLQECHHLHRTWFWSFTCLSSLPATQHEGMSLV